MIFTGFTDVNGNVIPVQGAGTVYDEEKNSLALGKDTVAIGQDQFVFGRSNVEDTNKVEIVGGGISKTDFGVIKYGQSEFHGTIELYANGYDNLVSKLKEDYNPNDVNTVILFDSDDSATNYANTKFFIIRYYYGSGEHEPNRSLIVYIENGSGDIIDNPSISVGTYKTRQVGASLNAMTPPTQFTISFSKSYYIVDAVVTSLEQKKNIRTLDWQGNQWNAGDITCDDGSGNTISMRNLLSRIATLEAAAANS